MTKNNWNFVLLSGFFPLFFYLIIFWDRWLAYFKILIMNGAFFLIGIIIPTIIIGHKEKLNGIIENRKWIGKIILLYFFFCSMLRNTTYFIVLILIPLIAVSLRFGFI